MQLFHIFIVSCMRTHESANSVLGVQVGGIIIGEFNCWHWTNGLITRGQLKMFTRAKSNANTHTKSQVETVEKSNMQLIVLETASQSKTIHIINDKLVRCVVAAALYNLFFVYLLLFL